MGNWRGLAALVLAGAVLAGAGEEPRVPDGELFKMEDNYVTGNYLVTGGLLAGVTAALTHDRDLALGFFAASVALRHAGMPLLGLNAEGLCRANGVDSYCLNNAFAVYGLNIAAEALLAYEVVAMAKDDYEGLPQSESRLTVAWAAAGCAMAAYLYAWYRFHEVRHRNVSEEGRLSLGFLAEPGGRMGLALNLRLGE